ncbi:uncharacterized protein LOC112683691 [Sipha flava]|uniref:Uncharacterized protein LOC112683691 n=2 Tax=Sipha flava TaxID=143950 RepID=A0A8B8FJE1_9HEMI|nr:uncharacterized protein LOC112683691 [Sipha flava]
MNSSNMPCEESVNAKSLKKNMAKYCMNTMRKRTIDEQLGDFSMIMGCPLDLRIVYSRTGLDVSYHVGSLSASVTGLDESMCVRQCKRDVLHKMKVFCDYINDGTRTSSSDWQARSNKSPSESSSKMQDVYSEIELSKERLTGKEARKAFNENIVLADPEMDVSRELCEFVDSNKSPLVLTVSYLPTEWKMTWDCGPYSASMDGPVKSMCMQECKILLLHELSVFVTDENLVDEEAVNSDNPTRTVIANRNDDSQEDNLQKLIDYEKPHGNVFNKSVSTIEPQEVSDHSIVSTVESDHLTSNTNDDTWNHMIDAQCVIGSVCNVCIFHT